MSQGWARRRWSGGASCLPTLQTPLADGCMGDGTSRPRAHSRACPPRELQGEAGGAPAPRADHRAWQAVIFVALAVGRRGHVWLPTCCVSGHAGRHRWGGVSHEAGTLDNKSTMPTPCLMLATECQKQDICSRAGPALSGTR